MKLASTPRIEFLRELVTEILGVYGLGRTVVAIDGTDAAERAAFADDLAAVFDEREHPVFSASLRDFRRSRAEQERFGPESPERLLRHLYDFSLLRRVLLDPFRLGGSTGFVTRAFDADRDAWIQPTWLTGPSDATLILDGEYLNRKELRDLWSYSVLVETEADAVRFGPGGAEDTGTVTEHEVADRLYRGEVRPRSRATAIVDVSNPADPRRVFLDSC
ncbi:hypothetical protein E3T40_14325 [Cryobacterium sp. TMT1-19]|uniref:hypothetical protein n=1 Tax=unclassified Cryobacterium TaxID=2649013 RepID=UPI000CE3C863|nr:MULTISPECIES: hypothetical protein [unclassified Cryobacterium]TFD31418.1 hypothetical protein E3T40_14325 [Cryobacterium sp. TMT1-19]